MEDDSRHLENLPVRVSYILALSNNVRLTKAFAGTSLQRNDLIPTADISRLVGSATHGMRMLGPLVGDGDYDEDEGTASAVMTFRRLVFCCLGTPISLFFDKTLCVSSINILEKTDPQFLSRH